MKSGATTRTIQSRRSRLHNLFSIHVIAIAALLPLSTAFTSKSSSWNNNNRSAGGSHHFRKPVAVAFPHSVPSVGCFSTTTTATSCLYSSPSEINDTIEEKEATTVPSMKPTETLTSPPNKIIQIIGKSTSSLVAGTFFLILAWKRDALMITFFIGAIGNGILSKILKRVLDQARPDALAEVESITLKPTDPGMPSSHAMSLGFIGTFTVLNLPQIALPIALYVLVALYYRVKINLHTKEQVSVGLVIGSFNGSIWNEYFAHSFFFNFVQDALLGHSGTLPIPYLAIPAVVGAMVVGSFERRISRWIKKSK